MRSILLLLAAAVAQTASAQTIRVGVVVTTPREHDALARRIVQRSQGAIRACFARVRDGRGEGRIVLRGRVVGGRVTNLAAVSNTGSPDTVAVQCTVAALRRRIRLPADSPVEDLLVPIHFAYPEPSLPDNALSEARAARRRGRCLVNAANELIAAIRAFERTRGRARERAHRRVEAAKIAVTACDGGVLGGVLHGQGPGVDTCPHCRRGESDSADSH